MSDANNFNEQKDTYESNANKNGERERERRRENEARLILNNEE